jgi:hypothetical protein
MPITSLSSQQVQLFSVVVRVHEVTSTTFVVSRQRLCRVSKFFDKAFSGSFLECHTGTLDLYEVSTYYFGLFLEWVTTGQLPALSLQHMVQLYILDDKYDAPEFRQYITDSLTNYCFGPRFVVPTTETIDLLLRNVPWSPPLKSLLANAVVRFAQFKPVSLLRSEFSEIVDELLEKPYGGLTNFGRSPYTAWQCPFPPCEFSPPYFTFPLVLSISLPVHTLVRS